MKKNSENPIQELPFNFNILASEGVKYPDDLCYFTEEEFNKLTPPCSLMDMDAQFMYGLDMARSFARVPFKITSAFRSLQWELEHGRKGTSSHCKGIAVDIACTDPVVRHSIIWALCWQFDWPRIGIAPNYIHVDIDRDKPAAFWLYP